MDDRRDVYAVMSDFERIDEANASTKPRVIRASYAGSLCKICRGEIERGDPIVKCGALSGGGYRHATCGEPPCVNFSPQIQGYQEGLKCVMCGEPLKTNELVQAFGGGCFQHKQCPKGYEGHGEPPWKKAQAAKAKEKVEGFPARYSGRCSKCGGCIEVGQRITGSSGRFYHAQCPPSAGTANVSAGENQQKEVGRTYSLGSGYVSQPPSVGQIVRLSKNLRGDGDKVAVVTKVDSRYIRDDGMSFGVGDEKGYVWTVHYRLATEDEEKTFLAKEEAKQNRSKTERDLTDAIKKLENLVRDKGKYQYGPNDSLLPFPEGETIFKDERGMLYGGGRWLIRTVDGAIWFIRNNGADGDDWSQNNIRTGGAGAIGRELKNNTEAEELAAQIVRLRLALDEPRA